MNISLPVGEGVKPDGLVTGNNAGQLPFDLNVSNCDATNFNFLIAFFSVGLDFSIPLTYKNYWCSA